MCEDAKSVVTGHGGLKSFTATEMLQHVVEYVPDEGCGKVVMRKTGRGAAGGGEKQATKRAGGDEVRKGEPLASAAGSGAGTNKDVKRMPSNGEQVLVECGTDNETEARADEQVRFKFVVPLASAGIIIGKQWKTIKGIKVKTGANVVLAKDPMENNSRHKELVIDGTRSQANEAEKELLAVMLQWLRKAPEQPGGG